VSGGIEEYLWEHKIFGRSESNISWIIKGMSFALKYLSAIRATGV
jgi:hypothetical protein